MRTLLIDGDLIAYQTAAGHETEIDWGDGLWTLHVNVPYACQAITEKFDHWLSKLGADQLVVCLSDREANFRQELFPGYKGSRSDKRLPTGLLAIRAWLEENHKTYVRPTLEADDVMGILATHPYLIEGEKIIVSEDKDMKTIPGLHFNPRKDTSEIEVSEYAADFFHMTQTLTGDTADEYPGCPGTGPVRAMKVLAEEPWWPRVVAAYEKAGLTEADALLQARLARILRSADYDFQKKEPILWSPPTTPTTSS